MAHIQAQGELEVVIAYGDARWAPIISTFQLPCTLLENWVLGSRVARLFMLLRIQATASRLLAERMNPLVQELHRLRCNLWIFPAQDELTWQVSGPVVATIHDLMHRYERRFPEAGNWFRYGIREHRFYNLARRSTAVLVDSPMGKQHVLESYGAVPERIHPLPYIAPSYIYEEGDQVRSDFDAHYKLPPKFYFYPAQFWQHKNHLRLIHALADARRVYADLTLVLAGGLRHEYASVHQLVLQRGLADAVRFVGYVPDADMAGFYKRARGLVMPTFFGPTNIPPLEAMALGCPVLVSNAYAMPEQCGDAALYFNPNSVEEIRDQMIRLWNHDGLYEELSKQGLKRAQEWGQSQFQQCLDEILAQTLTR
ncbi:glycosyltransferase family 4 protein [Laribacter hongkongensis]|uniref:glycosyltransferase family 4 protein n=1 Tax=Laribacter hongkongensis TaxID=168471 RepID=UPI001EFCCCAF|nr:glycosyltransferase family 1 protein [Laribacter hongkongensis]MCG9040728.1 glycosyltransferase family 4 protein [Laribacter hongkongensis]MCG9056236.1 glycosyltransferase family 4 protein [Laribacter hongkongensis]MCG9067884.1 glycosyltransferase family 4 protein [Laribacter hongkongensis]